MPEVGWGIGNGALADRELCGSMIKPLLVLATIVVFGGTVLTSFSARPELTLSRTLNTPVPVLVSTRAPVPSHHQVESVWKAVATIRR
jgi:hypothetical protein